MCILFFKKEDQKALIDRQKLFVAEFDLSSQCFFFNVHFLGAFHFTFRKHFQSVYTCVHCFVVLCGCQISYLFLSSLNLEGHILHRDRCFHLS